MNRRHLILFTSVLSVVFLVFIFILMGGENPFSFFGNLLKGALGSASAISYSLQFMTPLLFTGLACAIAFRAGLFNIGVEGQLIIGALCAAMAGYYINIPWRPAHLFIVMLCAAGGGALWALIPALLKVYLNINEVIVTIMMNYIALNLTNYLIMETPIRVDRSLPYSHNVLGTALLPRLEFLSSDTSLNSGFIIAVVLAIALAFIFRKTVFGFTVDAIGENKKASIFAGFPVKKYIIFTMLLSGAIAGLAGFEQVCGVYKHFVSPFPEGYGYLGIAVALMAANKPLLIMLTAALFGIFDAGSSYVDIISSVPREIIYIIEGLLIIAVSIRLGRKKEEIHV